MPSLLLSESERAGGRVVVVVVVEICAVTDAYISTSRNSTRTISRVKPSSMTA